MTKKDIINIFLGTFLMAVGICSFFDPHGLIIGGASGLSILLSEVFKRIFGEGPPLWLLFSVINIPLFGAGFRVLGFSSLRRSFFAAALLSAMIWAADFLPPVESDLPIAAVFGGFIEGIGLGLVLRSGSTTGGSDLLAMILTKYISGLSLSTLILATDCAIIALGFPVFGSINVFYAVVSAYITSKVIDLSLTGAGYTKAVYIISDKWEDISEKIMNEFERGVTTLKGRGEYTKDEKNVILCVIPKKQLAGLKKMVSDADNRAFLIITEAAEVAGEGFSDKK